MNEFSNDSFHDEDPDHTKRVEDIHAAVHTIDPNRWIGQSISGYKTRVKEIEMGLTTEYDMSSDDNDSLYKDNKLAELHEVLKQNYDVAIAAVAELQKAQRDIQDRRDALRNHDIAAQAAAKRILGADNVTVADLFPSNASSEGQ